MYNPEFDINIYNDSLSLGELLPPSLHWRSPINKRIKLCMIYSAAQRTKISNNSIFHSYIWNHPRLFQFWNWHFLGISSFNVTFYLTLVSLMRNCINKKKRTFHFLSCSQSTCRTEYRVPDFSLHNGRGSSLSLHLNNKHQVEHPLPALWTWGLCDNSTGGEQDLVTFI